MSKVREIVMPCLERVWTTLNSMPAITSTNDIAMLLDRPHWETTWIIRNAVELYCGRIPGMPGTLLNE